jgi:hypothetical protein
VSTRFVLAIIVSLLTAGTAFADTTQAQLDAACEAAREKKLAPLRQNMVNECAAKGEKTEAECTQFYADWDGGRGAGLSKQFYDLPECETAFDNQRDSAAS